ncbi:Acyltransferase family protein [Pseudobutyrivibrio sp. 49]|uniref:acyltransferase family protein n=1 Tax=Pseudobutyrivibrio sp. 49 TaxID=1855344 RepID=UPI000886E50D|nr:acyltransferase [Pseudobutyrivibrio sp. 49]SDI71747.1 Acyltransferase family protein [Pseudobutyrivibrio sp. 49]
MNFILLLVILVSLFGVHYRKEPSADYISPNQTAAINGIFVMFVFMRHINQYLTAGKYDKIFEIFNFGIDQLIVTTFLFYSGYGIMYSLHNKNNYIDTMPKRILKILIQFDLAIILYLIVSIIVGEHYSVPDILLAFVAWKSLGNSNWYIFAILFMYVSTFIVGKILNKSNVLTPILVTLFAMIYIIFTRHFGKGFHWYSTIFCYPLGMFFEIYKDKLNDFFKKNILNRVIAFILMAVPFTISFWICKTSGNSHVVLLAYELSTITFVLSIVALSTLFEFCNPVINYFGKNVFEIYILQRIPMILLENRLSNQYIYFFICFGITLLLAIGFKKLMKYIPV